MKQLTSSSTLVIYIIILALGLRLPQLAGSFWLDEAAQALEGIRPWSDQLNISYDFQPPLLHLLLFIPLRISQAEWWLRTIGALIPGLITILMTYKIGKKIYHQTAGLMASLLLATSSFHIFYSQELRPYSLPAMWASLSWWWLIQTTSLKKNKKYWLLYTLATILGLYSSYLYPFFWLSQLVWIFWQKRLFLKKFFQTGFFAGLAFLPWLPKFFEQLSVGSAVRSDLPGWESVVSISQLKSLPLVAGKFLFGMMNLEFNSFFIALTFVVIAVSGLIIRKNYSRLIKTKNILSLSLVSCWLIIPTISAWLVSFWVPVVRPKRLLLLLPAFYLLAVGIAGLTSKKYRHFGNLLISLILIINLIGVFQYQTNPAYQRENWRAAHQLIQSRYSPTETIAVFSFPEAFAPWRWYDQDQYPVLATGTLHINQVTNLTEFISPVSEYHYVIVFDYLSDLTDPDNLIRHELWALGFHEIDTLDYPQLGTIRVFSRTRPTADL